MPDHEAGLFDYFFSAETVLFSHTISVRTVSAKPSGRAARTIRRLNFLNLISVTARVWTLEAVEFWQSPPPLAFACGTKQTPRSGNIHSAILCARETSHGRLHRRRDHILLNVK